MCNLSALKCPLCAQTNFPNIDSLRVSLIKVANGPLACPICHEKFLGLDKLTIHLFSHSNVMVSDPASKPTAVEFGDEAEAERITIDPTAKNASVKFNVRLELKDIKHNMSKEEKAKNTQIIKDEPKTIEKLNATTSYDVESVKSENGTAVNKSEPKLSICDICEFTFRDEKLLDMHFSLVHQNVTKSNNDLLNNGYPSSEHDFKCHLCSKTFKMKGSLRVHLKVVHLLCLPHLGNSSKPSICDRIRQKGTKVDVPTNNNIHCIMQPMSIKTDNGDSKMFQSPTTQSFQHHNTTKIVNPNRFTFDALTLLPTSTVTANAEESCLDLNGNSDLVHTVDVGPLSSNVLLVMNTNPSALSNPTSGIVVCSGSIEPKILMKTDSELLELQHKNTVDSAKIWKCTECTKTFTTKYFLKKHKRLHTGEMPYTCEICARTFTFQQSYHKHLLYHSNEKPHICSTCGRAFKELSTLHNHERIHSGEKPFKCEVCGKCFRQRVSFLVHTRIHTGIMPYKCEVCQKSFRYKVSQRTHKCRPEQFSSEATNISDKNESEQVSDDISENFIQEFLLNTNVQMGDASNLSTSTEIAAINNTSDCNGNVDEVFLINKAIDDIIVESCNKMGIDSQRFRIPDEPPLAYSDDCNSPTQLLQNMKLYSPQLGTDMPESGTDIVDNIFSNFLLTSEGTNIL